MIKYILIAVIMGKSKKLQEFSKWWRPELYTPEELWNEANKYFKHCMEEIIDRGSNGKTHKPLTVSWLNLWLWVSKNYLSEKAKHEGFLGTVEYIRSFIENDVEEKALIWVYSPSASSFNLKNNFWWREKQEVDQTTKNYTFTSNLEDEEMYKRILENNAHYEKNSTHN